MSPRDAIQGAIQTQLATCRRDLQQLVEFVLERRGQCNVSSWRADCISHRRSQGETQMKTQLKIFASVGIALLTATTSFAQQVKTDYDRSANFSQYRTYSWEKVQTQDPLLVDRITEAVNTALSAKGWTPVPSGGNVSVVAIEMTRNQRSLNTFYNSFGG